MTLMQTLSFGFTIIVGPGTEQLYPCSSITVSGGVIIICCNIVCYVCIVTQIKIHVTRLKQDVTLRKMRVSCREFIFGDTFYICV